jgi:hypothetical protein
MNDPKYIAEFWSEHLKPRLDLDYLKEGKKHQGAGPMHSKL